MLKRTAMIALWTALTLAAPAPAQPTPPGERNAALQYAAVFYTADADMFAAASEVEMHKVGFDKAKAPAAFTKAVDLIAKRGEGAVGQLIAASRLAGCDFELPMENGINVLLPHLGKLRGAARLLRVDSRARLLDGDTAGAAERIAAMARIAHHAVNDHVLISSLVGAAISNAAADEAEAQLESGLLDGAARATMAAGLRCLGPADPFAMKEAMRGEQRLIGVWVKANFRGPNAGAELGKVLGPIAEGEAPAVPRTLTVMNGDQISAAADLLVPYYDQVLAAWDSPDALAELQKLGDRVNGGAFGPLGQVLAPAVSKAWASGKKAEKRLAIAIERLASK